MKIEFDLPDTSEKMVLCTQKNPTTLAYFNIFEDGDIWIKIKGCEGCSWENRQKCCAGCPMLTEKGCFFQLQSPEDTNKPFSCVTLPEPTAVRSFCQLEFECIKGKNKGKIKKVNTPHLNLIR